MCCLIRYRSWSYEVLVHTINKRTQGASVSHRAVSRSYKKKSALGEKHAWHKNMRETWRSLENPRLDSQILSLSLIFMFLALLSKICTHKIFKNKKSVKICSHGMMETKTCLHRGRTRKLRMRWSTKACDSVW